MNKLSLLIKALSISLLIVFFTNSVSYAIESAIPNAQTKCGEWKTEGSSSSQDQRIGITLLRQAAGNECNGVFTLSNQTGTFLGGGYTLKLTTSTNNAKTQFLPKNDPYLIPGLNIEIQTTPIDINSQASVNIMGDLSLGAFTIDLSLFLLRTGINLMDKYIPTGCLVSYDQIYLVALRVAPILEKTTQLAFNGDLIGSKEELSRVITVFYERAGDAFRDIGIGCAIDLVQLLIKTPLAIAKIIIDYLTWVPVVIFDYIKYQGNFALVHLSYTPASTSNPNLPFYDGSYYELVYSSSPVTWDRAVALASSRKNQSCGSAHLATVTSSSEQAVLSNLMKTATNNGWIGGYQPDNEKSLASGWKWITGESFTYTNWDPPSSIVPLGEPNDTPYGTFEPGSEQNLEIYSGSGVWNDAPNSDLKYYYIVEYEGC